MKKTFTLLTTIIFTITLFSQSPQKFSYQALVRNALGELVKSSPVGIKVSILQTTSNGTVVYAETQSTTTNNNGLVTIEIGRGSIVSGIFSTINWANGPYFIKTETDPTGGTSYSISGTSELLSVPYALFSANSTPGPQGPAGLLTPGIAAGNTPFWNGSAWITNNSNIFNNGGNIGIGTTTPSTKLDIAGGNNWDLINGEGDFRIGNSQYRIKMGVALSGGGAGDAGIMQYGQPGGYNVLSLGAQGHKLLYLNGETQRVGIGTAAPGTTLDVRGTVSIVDGTQGTGKVLTSDASGNATWQNSNSGVHTIGESFGGGIVFFVYDNGQHGLIAATTDQGTAIPWDNVTTEPNAFRDGIGAGEFNTERIIENQSSVNQGTGVYAAYICANYQGGNYGDWYLPSKYELNLLYLQKVVVGVPTIAPYWSSSEDNNHNLAWYQNFINGAQGNILKTQPFSVRAVRAF